MTSPAMPYPEAARCALSEAGARLTRMNPKLGFGTAAPPGEPGWARLSEAVDSGFLDDLAAQLVTKLGRPGVVGSYLGARFTDPLVSRTVAALVLDRRCPDPDARTVHVHRTEAKLDRIAFTGDAAVLRTDPWAPGPGTVVLADDAELRDWWAAGLVATVGPLLAAVHDRFRFGHRGLWGAVAARVGATISALARDPHAGTAATWQEAELLLDALAAHAPARIVRPVPLDVPWSGGTSLYSIRGTCCLKYRVKSEPDMATGKGYCSTCSLIDRPCMVANLGRKLDRERAS